MRERIKWIDVARCLGMFAIYLGHFRPGAGQGADFVYTHHVALFFFLSGCMENYSKEKSFGQRLKKTANTILLPWFVFSMVAIIVEVIYSDSSLGRVVELIKIVAMGTICDTFVAGALWFLICLALVKMAFWVLLQLKNRWLMVAIAVIMFYIEAVAELPKYYNFYRVFRFMIYYVTGYLVFGMICQALEAKTRKGRMLLILSAIVSFSYSVLVFLGKNPLTFMNSIPHVKYLVPIAQSLIMIWLYLIVAKLAENIAIFQELGQNSLYLCVSEYFVMIFFKSLVRIVGLELTMTRPFTVYLFSAIMMITALRLLVPLEKRILAKIRKLPDYLFL